MESVSCTISSVSCILSFDPPSVGRVAGGQVFWLVGGGRKVWAGRKQQRAERRSITRQFDGRGQRERGLWVECHTEEFCVKVLKFEIVNSRKSFNYFSGVVPRTIEKFSPVTLFPGRFKNGPFKNREDDTRSLSQN